MKVVERSCPCCGADASHIRFLFDVENFGRRFGQYECRNCEFQFTDPVLSPEETAACYDADYYASGEKPGAAGRYQDYDGQIRETLVFFRRWLSEFEDRGGLRLLDVGCALGRFMDVASSDYGYSCTGIELSDVAREFVRKTYGDRFSSYATLNDLPHQHDPFDVILLFDVIEHVPSPWELLWPLFQRGCVGENTRVLITTPNAASLQAGRDGAKWMYRYPPIHIGFYAPSTLAFVARALLFERCRVFGHSPFPDHIPLETAFDRQHFGFDGLACEFRGSWLPRLETLQPSALETFESPAYARLLRQWTFRVLPHPENVALYKNVCAVLRQAEADLSDERTKCAQAQVAANEKLAVECAKLKEVLEVERRKAVVLAGDRDQLQTENQELAEKAEAIDVERGRLADTCCLQKREIARVTDEYVRILAEYQRCHACYEGLLATYSSLERERHARLWIPFFCRLGRGLAHPCRLIRNGIVGLRTRIDAKLKVFGRKYVLRLIVHKMLHRSIVKRYSVIASIGVNCEVSFNIDRVFGFVDSYPLTWAFVDKVGGLPGFLKDPKQVLSSANVVHDYSCNMCLYSDVGIHFHCQGGPETLWDEKGMVDPAKSRAALDEVASRMRHLSDKWMSLVNDPSRSLLCVLTPWEQTRTKEILVVWKCLRRYPRVRLLVVMTGNERGLSATALRLHGIFVRRIKCHPPHDAVTDLARNDIKGWNQVFDEFRPTEIRTKNKAFKYEH